VLFEEIFRVAPGSVSALDLIDLVSENGRNTGEPSSSSASESGFKGALLVEYRGRRAKARLRDIGCRASDSDEDELEVSLSIAKVLEAFSSDRCLCFGEASPDCREASRLSRRCLKDGCVSREERAAVVVEGAWTCVIVFVDAFRDKGYPTKLSMRINVLVCLSKPLTGRFPSALSSPLEDVRSLGLWESDEGTLEPPYVSSFK